MAGVEAAGLVLATFPIVLECINKMKGIRNHRVILRQMAREMKAEMTIFRNSWNRLLDLTGEDIISGTPDRDCILDLCEDLLDILEELKLKFGHQGAAVCFLSVNIHAPV